MEGGRHAAESPAGMARNRGPARGGIRGRHRAEYAHWYLPQIGVEPNAQGRGLGGELMRHALARCDQEQALAYLEASKPENIPFYQRYGFKVIGEIQIGAAPVVTPMLRRPRVGP